MHKKKIIIVSSSFYPNNSPRSFRTTELAKELARQGHEVVVYIPFRGFNYSAFATDNHLITRDMGVMRFKDIELKGSKWKVLIKRLIRRVLSLLVEYPNIELMFKVSKSLKRESGHDLLISVAVPFPIHWGVAKVRTKKHQIADVWIADCGDPYMGDTTDSFRKMFYFKYIEKWFCRKANFITIPFKGALSAYYPEFHEKIRIIPQGIRLEGLKIPDYRKANDYPVFAYAGGFIPGKRDPKALLYFLSACNKKFKFVVYTSQTEIIFPYQQILQDKLVINNSIPREDLLEVLSGMDFLINLDNNTPTQLPSKLIDYAITSRPVLNVTSETDFTLLLEFMDGNYTGRMNLEPYQKYDIRVVAQAFVRLHNNA
jgi:glycosyltransferase involved in cell wall biosynthesis